MQSTVVSLTFALALVACLAIPPARAAVSVLEFATDHPPPVVAFPPEQRQYEAMFRAALSAVPESTLVPLVLAMQGGKLGLSEEQQRELLPLISESYAAITNDPLWTDLPSALPYAFASEPRRVGQAFLYRPEDLGDQPRCIVFLHGYGGNFQLYMRVLAEAFPEAIILAPAWADSWHAGSSAYLEDLLAAAEEQLGRELPQPWLLGLSAGGRGGFRIYAETPQRWRGFVCLANAPENASARALPRDGRILMLNGTNDDLVPLRVAQRQARLATRHAPNLRFQEMDGGHFFLLTQREKTVAAIKEFMREVADR